MIFKGKELKTMGDTFSVALKLAKESPNEEAPEFFKEYVKAIMEANSNLTEEQCIAAAKNNLGYFAGYYDEETANIIRKVYGAAHPIFG